MAEIRVKVHWEGLRVELWTDNGTIGDTLGRVGNEMLRLNSALETMGAAGAPVESEELKRLMLRDDESE